MRRWQLFTVIASVGLVLDQASKLYIDRVMSLYQSIPVIDGLFNIFYIRNKGAAFSFLSHASWRVPFFIAVSLVASLVIVVAFGRLRDDQRLAQVSLAMIFSGAVGNLIDRIRLGEVIDFLDVYWKTHHWPAFNVADSCICVGVALLALDMMREERRKKA
ncbi:signal peptidase II [Geobacter sp. SVR]|uniref:signal peptidase II n=1 Tax=Geobacter sp. SVR TaxID=2495594 RepID=UPI00143F0009|nr:signal peptidase II [Geobacter sp. SVR]BCS51732.1 lipoprotein signal peptidase [Geobacter sp. SVR]GCF84919.1 lipoprotein signal peptidase [Geobacter sp. SVR]